MAEFAYNNTISAGIGNITPFFANYGYNPRFDYMQQPDMELAVPEVQDVHETLTKLEHYLKTEMKWSQAQYADQTNKHRMSPPKYEPGDEVWLNGKNIKTTRPTNKFDYRKLGRFKVEQKVGTHAYKLKLPPKYKDIHPVFHTNLLEPAATDPLPGQRNPTPPPIIIDNEEHYKVDRILDSRKFKNRKEHEYLVSWKGYGPRDITWEKASNLTTSARKVHEFHSVFPDKPRPNKLPDLPEDDTSEDEA